MEKSKIKLAMDLEKEMHAGQERKYTKEPYIVHPFAVAGLVASVSNDEAMVIAALLHDVVEDTDCKLSTIEKLFGLKVASMVHDLTSLSKPEDGNRSTRKAIDRYHLSQASTKSKTIKLADLIDNIKTIVAHDPKFAQIYMAEKRLLLEVLRGGSERLFQIASHLVGSYFKKNHKL